MSISKATAKTERYKDTAKWVSSHRCIDETNHLLLGSKPKSYFTMAGTHQKARHNYISHILSQPTFPHELDINDKRSSLKITSTSSQISSLNAWWMGAFKSTFPQDCFREKGHFSTVRPAQGVTVRLDKRNGVLRIKGKHHWEWFTANFEMILQRGSHNAAFTDELQSTIDRHLGIGGINMDEITEDIPQSGAIKNGPGFIYTSWKVLLNDWMKHGANITIATPRLDSERLVDIVLLMIRNRGSGYHVRLCIQKHCDGDTKYSVVRGVATRIIKNLTSLDKRKQLITKAKLSWAYEHLDLAFLRFNCNFIGMTSGDDAEILVTSANFHKKHFVAINRDTVSYNKISISEYRKNFLDTLGLSYSIINGKFANGYSKDTEV